MGFLGILLFIDALRFKAQTLIRYHKLALYHVIISFAITVLLSMLILGSFSPAIFLLPMIDVRITPFLLSYPGFPPRIRQLMNIEGALSALLGALVLTCVIGMIPLQFIVLGLIAGHFFRHALSYLLSLYRPLMMPIALVVLMFFVFSHYQAVSVSDWVMAALLLLIRPLVIGVTLMLRGFCKETFILFSLLSPKGSVAMLLAFFVPLPAPIYLALLLSVALHLVLVLPLSRMYGARFTGRDLYSKLQEHVPVVEFNPPFC